MHNLTKEDANEVLEERAKGIEDHFCTFAVGVMSPLTVKIAKWIAEIFRNAKLTIPPDSAP